MPHEVLTVTVLALLLVVNASGVIMVMFQLPGTWLILGATSVAAWVLRDQGTFGLWTVGILLALAILGEIVETLSGAIGSRGSGGSRRGALLSILTGIAGAMIGGSLAGSLTLPFVWAVPAWVGVVIVGAAIGAGVGSFAGDRLAGRSWTKAGRAAAGAAVGRLAGTVTKVLLAAAMWAVVVGAIFL